MSTTLNRESYEKLVAEDLEWLLKQPRILERDHVECILRTSSEILYTQVPLVVAVDILIKAALRLIQVDPHQWSERPCQTCRTVSSVTGQKFGCELYREQRGL